MNTVYKRKLYDDFCDTRNKCSDCKKKCPQFWKKARRIVYYREILSPEKKKLFEGVK